MSVELAIKKMAEQIENHSSPEFPALTPAENDQIPTAENPVEASTFEKVRAAGEGVIAQFGIKRGRGRPRKDGQPKANDTVSPANKENSGAVAVAVAANPTPTYGPLFSRSITSLVKGALDWAKTVIRSKSKQAGIDDSFTSAALKECEVETQVMTDFNESLSIVLEKYKVDSQYAPEVALCVASARLAGPYLILLRTFDVEIKRKNQLEKLKGAAK